MSDDTRPGGEDKAWVDPQRAAPQNAFDKDDGYSGQQYDRRAEEQQGREDRAHDTPHERAQPEHAPPEDPNDFKVPGSSGPRELP
jgi:hypothetical protein